MAVVVGETAFSASERLVVLRLTSADPTDRIVLSPEEADLLAKMVLPHSASFSEALRRAAYQARGSYVEARDPPDDPGDSGPPRRK